MHRPEAMQFRHILCPIDFSEPSRAAMRMAAELARSSGGVLTLLHVTQVPKIRGHQPMVIETMVAGARGPALQAIGRWRTEAAAGGGVSVRAEVRVGVCLLVDSEE